MVTKLRFFIALLLIPISEICHSESRSTLTVHELKTGSDISDHVHIINDDNDDCPLFYNIFEEQDIPNFLMDKTMSLGNEESIFYLTTVYMAYSLIANHRFEMRDDLCYSLGLTGMGLPIIKIRLPEELVKKIDDRDFGLDDKRVLKSSEQNRIKEPPFPLINLFSEAYLYSTSVSDDFRLDHKMTDRYKSYIPHFSFPSVSDYVRESSIEDAYSIHLTELKRKRTEIARDDSSSLPSPPKPNSEWVITRTVDGGYGYYEHYVQCDDRSMVIVPESRGTNTYQGGGTFHLSMQSAVDAACN